jgi:hyperosmotically inducible periplasmic protein
MRALFRLVFTLILLVSAGGIGYYYGYRAATGREDLRVRSVLGTSGSRLAGEARAEATTIGRTLVAASGHAGGFLSDAALTTKIRSKMELDDSLNARTIHVSTTDAAVTLTGTVRSNAERARAVALARETRGVKSVADRLESR